MTSVVNQTMADNELRWYYDQGDISDESGNIDEVYGGTMSLSTREDVENDRSEYTFDLLPSETISGIEAFTQNIVVQFVQATSLSPDELTEKLETVEREIEQIASEYAGVEKVHTATVQQSKRYDDEVVIDLTIQTEEGQSSTEFYIGNEETIDS